MALYILHAKNNKDLDKIEGELINNKFKVISAEDNYVLMKKRRYGNAVIQLGLLFFALFFTYPIIIINLVYFTYSFLFRSPNVLVTTETKDVEGEDLKFASMEEVLEKANAIL